MTPSHIMNTSQQGMGECSAAANVCLYLTSTGGSMA